MSSFELPRHQYLGGTETEYPVMMRQPAPHDACYTNPGWQERHMEDLEASNLVSQYVPVVLHDAASDTSGEFAGLIGQYASNGSRIYKDVGSKPEYATPEAASYRDSVHATIAGEQIILQALRKYTASKDGLRFVVLGRVIDKEGVSWGKHESYLLDRQVFPYEIDATGDDARNKLLMQRLLCQAGIAHLATRQLFTGGGISLPNKNGSGSHYERSQKIPSLNRIIDSGTTGKQKPLFNTRDESLTNKDKYFRWHVTSGDYHLSPWAAWMNLGTTDLLGYLALIQTVSGEGALQQLALKGGQELAIAKAISQDEQHVFELESGKRAQAVDVQEMLCDKLEKLQAQHPSLFTSEDGEIISELRFAVDAQRNNPELLSLAVDWRKRHEILRAYKDAHPRADFATLHRVEQCWDNLATGKGVQLRPLTRMPGYEPERIEYFMHSAPEGTRAETRSRLIKRHNAPACVVTGAVWQTVTLTEEGNGVRVVTRHDLSDPYGLEVSTNATKTLLSKAS